MRARARYFVLAAALLIYNASADQPEDLLKQLGSDLLKVRAAVGDKPLSVDTTGVDAMKGLSREKVISALGKPDNCVELSRDECAALESWTYYFFYLPPGWRGGGPELWLTFRGNSVVEDARWQFSR